MPIPFLSLLIFPTIALSDALSPNEVSMGTTILAVRYNGGIVVGADTRTSVSGYVSNRYAAKLTFVLDREVDEFVIPIVRSRSDNNRGGFSGVVELIEDDTTSFDGTSDEQNSNKQQTQTSNEEKSNALTTLPTPEASTCVICRSGSAADTQHLASVIRTELVARQLLYRIRGTVSHAASLSRNLLVNEPNLSASLICAGYDHVLGRGVIYTISPGGTVFEERAWAAGGSGSSYILGHLDSFNPRYERGGSNLLLESEEEALDFVCNAIGLAMDRDGSSGGFARMYVIDRSGKRFVSRMPSLRKERSMVNTYNMRGDESLRHFAPATSPVKTGSSGSSD